MAIWRFEDKYPIVGDTTYVAQSADVIGNVEIGENCYIGPGARIRGDYGRVVIGDGCSIQENVVIHARPDDQTTIGNNVTVGHGALLHNCSIDDNAVVGMRSIVSDFAHLKEWSILGEGALAKNSFVLDEGDIAVGVPAKVIGNVNSKPKTKEELWGYKLKYQEMAKRHIADGALEKIRD
ncbi:MAG: gamma carbonic anhydrase family protein [Candidatus Kariarchaeaceae archaeon]|jgi:carbonic anhydrase/acetyltransferase-like protein (isoleucine patch superfamily)